METVITRAIVLGLMMFSAFSLGFMSGKTYLKRKMRRREDEAELADYLPDNLEGLAPPPEEDDDTKTGELETEKVTQGHPEDA